MSENLDIQARVRPTLVGFEPYDPSFTPCVVNLSANENTHAMPEAVRASLERVLLATPLNRYPDPMANELRDALAVWHGVSRQNLMVGNGGDEILFNIFFTFGGPGRTLVVTPPCFEEYKNFAKMCDCEIVEVWRDEDSFALDVDAIVDAAADAAIIVVTSPNNPTGDLVSPGVVRRLLDETQALVLVDEAYVEFAPVGSSLVEWVADNPRLMVLRTLSKAFALAGLRCGYLIAHPAIIDALASIRQIYSEDVLAQAVGKAAVEAREVLQPVLTDIVCERKRLSKELMGMKGVHVWPSEANFLLVRMEGASIVRARLRDEYSVLVRDFSYAKGLTDCLRISVGTHEENDRLLEALRALLGETGSV